jgi:hypothetical protein
MVVDGEVIGSFLNSSQIGDKAGLGSTLGGLEGNGERDRDLGVSTGFSK